MAELQSYSNSADVPVLEYITDNPRVHGQPMCLAGTHSLRVDKAIVAQLVGFNPENKDVPESEIFSVFLSAWITFLAKYTRNDSVAVWCGGDARETPRFGVEVAIPTEISFQELVNTVSLTQSRYSPSGLESFQARFSYFPDGVAPPTVDLGQTISFELRLVLTAQPDGSCQGEFQYCQLFDVGNVALMAAHFLHLLGALQPQAAALPLLRLPFMDGEEADLVVRQWSMHPDSLATDEKTIADLFCEQVEATPEATAVMYNDITWSFRELYVAARQIAETLMAHGAGPEKLVSLYMDRDGLDMVAAIYGCVLCGAGYLPIDPEYPMDRVEDILSDAAPVVMLTVGVLRWKIRHTYLGPLHTIDSLLKGVQLEDAHVEVAVPEMEGRNADNVLYVLYTSGSTGRPKGAIVEHRAMVRRSRWLQHRFPLQASDRMLQKTPYVFGVSEWEFFWTLLVGAQLVVVPAESHKHADFLHEAMQRFDCTVACFVPSMLNVFIETAETEKVPHLPLVRHILVAGEGLPPNLCQMFYTSGVFPTATLDNLYGPTEAEMTHWQCPRLQPGDPLPTVLIGKPISNTEVYVLDQWMEPVPIGVPGEICFGGRGVSRGYVNRPELTAKAFIDNPFREGRLYRTGDLGIWLPTGDLKCLGRMDGQVKLRGLRIELGEIEAALASCEGVRQACVLLMGSGLMAQLVAYIKCSKGSKVFEKAEVALEHIKKRVPAYMVPTHIMRLDNFPFNVNGKLDRRKLPLPESLAAQLAQQEQQGKQEQPAGGGEGKEGKGGGKGKLGSGDAVEQAVQAVWQEVLGLPGPLDPKADFQQLGGNSLLAGRVTHLIRKRIAPKVAATSVYRHGTIDTLAKYLRSLPDDARLPLDQTPSEPTTAQAEAKAAEDAHIKTKWKGHSSTAFVTLVLQIFGLMFTAGVGDFLYWPAYGILYAIYLNHGVVMTVAMLAPVLGLTTIALCVFTILLKWLVLGRVKPGRYPLWGWFYFRWWLMRNLVGTANSHIQFACQNTPIANLWWSLLGARIGKGVRIGAGVKLTDPDLIVIGEGAAIRHQVSLLPYAIENGELILGLIDIGARCDLSSCAYASPGTSVPPATLVGPLSTTGAGVKIMRPLTEEEQAAMVPRTEQTFLRVTVGLALLILLETFPYFPILYLLQVLWAGLDTLCGDNYWITYTVFCGIMPWLLHFVLPEIYFFAVVVMKWGVVGTFREGPRTHTTWDDFRRWLMEGMVNSELFAGAMAPWISCELLSIRYRLLGAKIGRRVQIDFFYCVEHDLITVEDNVTFGSKVVLHPADEEVNERIYIEEEANVLDHCLLMPGARVQREAMLGTYSLAAKGATFAPGSIHTGNENGNAVYLRQQYVPPMPNPSESIDLEGGSRAPLIEGNSLVVPLLSAMDGMQPAAEADKKLVTKPAEQGGVPQNLDDPAELRRLAQLARSRHEDTRHWLLMNFICMSASIVFLPLPDVLATATLALDYLAYKNHQDLIIATAVLPPALIVIGALELFIYWLMKNLVLGKFKEGNKIFYSAYHYQWMTMMALRGALSSGVLLEMSGTYFAAAFARLMGSQVGEDACLLNFVTTEYDLLDVGKGSTIGDDCDMSSHTVERMVIQLRRVSVHKQGTVRNGAIVMPGATMCRRGVLLEAGQVLKGETVNPGEVWAGLPALPVSKVGARESVHTDGLH
ncbi:hypothetical protein CYMTET_20863 [Cymbomonas tetramitiformis]|uniref:Carrier domain-containing protein n=1 Tax=Cymbomonas tetramitiformis TaxID=36881 RepID=A0AAE0L3U4_9CHLO|nr:hypothetical protein CYMTET_20863 [Cymbomonas tetramitiformis]